MVPDQLSDSCLHYMMDASQIGDEPFNFWGGGLNKKVFAILMWKHMHTCGWLSTCLSNIFYVVQLTMSDQHIIKCL